MNLLLDTFFFSGSSNLTDLQATIDGGGNPGLVSSRLSSNSLRLLSETVGFPVFVDSGAFGGDVSDFDAVFDAYDKVVARVGARRAYLVMPDVFLDQEASLRVLAEHADTVRHYIRLGCEAIVPLQRGERPLSVLYGRVVELLGTDNFRAGLPMGHKARHSQEQIHAFLRDSRPAKVHFLGRSFRPLKQELEYYKTFSHFHASADAAMLVNWVSSGKACGDNIQYAFDQSEADTFTDFDDTELMYDLFNSSDVFSDGELEIIAKDFRLARPQLESAIKNEVWNELVEEQTYGGMTAPLLVSKLIRSHVTPKSHFRKTYLREKVRSYLNGNIYERISSTPQAEFQLA